MGKLRQFKLGEHNGNVWKCWVWNDWGNVGVIGGNVGCNWVDTNINRYMILRMENDISNTTKYHQPPVNPIKSDTIDT